MEREAILVALDVGTSKIVALIGEVTSDGSVTIIGKGGLPSSGLKKGVVINIEQTVSSIRAAREAAERLSGYRIELAIVGVGGNHLESQNSRGAVAVSGPHREVTREDVERATEVARAVSIPSNREVLHVLPRGFVVDGQEGVKDPLGMSAVRLEVETHIVHAGATAVQNLTKCVQRADIRIDELVCASLASGDAVLTETERELGVAVADFGAGTIDLALFMDGSPFHTGVLPLGGNNVTNDVAIGLKTSLAAAEDLKISHGTADPDSVERDEQVEVAGIGEGDASTRLALRAGADHRGAHARGVREDRRGDRACRLSRPAARRPGADRRSGAAGGRGPARPRSAPDAGARGRPDRRQRPDRPSADARLQHRRSGC